MDQRLQQALFVGGKYAPRARGDRELFHLQRNQTCPPDAGRQDFASAATPVRGDRAGLLRLRATPGSRDRTRPTDPPLASRPAWDGSIAPHPDRLPIPPRSRPPPRLRPPRKPRVRSRPDLRRRPPSALSLLRRGPPWARRVRTRRARPEAGVAWSPRRRTRTPRRLPPRARDPRSGHARLTSNDAGDRSPRPRDRCGRGGRCPETRRVVALRSAGILSRSPRSPSPPPRSASAAP